MLYSIGRLCQSTVFRGLVAGSTLLGGLMV